MGVSGNSSARIISGHVEGVGFFGALPPPEIQRENTNYALPPKYDIVYVTPGVKGNWNQELNNPKPYTVYLSRETGDSYVTDGYGKTERVTNFEYGGKADRNTYQQRKAGREGGDGYHGGHWKPSSLGGIGERINLDAMSPRMNLSDMKVIDNEIAKALSNGEDASAFRRIERDHEGVVISATVDIMIGTSTKRVTVKNE